MAISFANNDPRIAPSRKKNKEIRTKHNNEIQDFKEKENEKKSEYFAEKINKR
jgi:hypothetical protein